MTSTSHCLLVGEGANKFAREAGFAHVATSELVSEYATTSLEAAKAEGVAGMNEGSNGTVGAVAIDRWGNMAAATSTGGMANQKRGRVGDSPINGAGVYADSKGVNSYYFSFSRFLTFYFMLLIVAVSLTGFGECLLRTLASKRIADNIILKGLDPTASIEECMDYATSKVGGDGGGIAVDAEGRIGVGFNSARMGWAYAKNGKVTKGCERGQVIQEDV